MKSEHPPHTELKKGTFLIASPEIEESLFFRSVILLCDHSSLGSFGLIINKPLNIDMPSDLIRPDELINPNIHFRAGGPHQPNQMMLLHDCDHESDSLLKVCDGVFLGGDLEFLQDASTRLDGPSILLCFGYGSWGSGLLEREFLKGAWFLHPASSRHVFQTPPEKGWQTILREMGGKYATLSMMPEDLELN